MSEIFIQGFAAFTGGVLLNLTPCVLPILPLKVRAIIAETHAGPARRFKAALGLLAGSLAVFMPLGLISAVLNFQWGFLFQSRGFLIVLAAMLLLGGVLMVLNVPIRLPAVSFESGSRRSEPFVTGVLAGILATPCTGPFVGSALAFSLTQAPSTTLLIFLSIGAGLAAPYCLLLLSPRLLARVPRSSAWTARVEELLGFILLASGIFFVDSLVPGPVGRSLWYALGATIFAWALWHLWHGDSMAARLLPALGLTAALAAGVATARSEADQSVVWEPYSEQVLVEASRRRQPVLIEFTADWCINCKVIERTVYRHSAVTDAIKSLGYLPMQVDLTRPSAEQQSLLRRYGGAGIPFSVILGPLGQIRHRFHDLFTVNQIREALVTAAEQ